MKKAIIVDRFTGYEIRMPKPGTPSCSVPVPELPANIPDYETYRYYAIVRDQIGNFEYIYVEAHP